MKRKKAIKQKKKAIQEIDRHILDVMGDTLKVMAVKPNKDNPLKSIAKLFGLGFKIQSLLGQKKMIISQPISSKKFKSGCMMIGELNSTPNHGTLEGRKSEMILNTAGSKLKQSININCNKEVIDKLDSIEIRFKQ